MEFVTNLLVITERSFSFGIYLPIGSMYAIYGNIYHQYTPNVSIYSIHGSYGLRKTLAPRINGCLCLSLPKSAGCFCCAARLGKHAGCFSV